MRKIVLIEQHDTTGSLIDEVIYTTQSFFFFFLVAGKPQMVVQLAAPRPRILRNNMNVPVTRDPQPAVLLEFEFHN